MDNTFLNSLMTFLSVGHNEVTSLSERRSYLRISVNLALPVTLLFSVFNVFSHFHALAVIEALSAILLLLPTYWLGRKDHLVSVAEYMVLLYGVIITTALVIYGGIAGTGILWIFSFPFLAFLLKGQRIGWISCACWVFVMHLAFTYGSSLENAHEYNEVFSQQSYAAMVFFSMIAAAFNLVRSEFEVRLDRKVKLNIRKAEHYLEKLQYLALHDKATDLPNRAHTLRHLAKMLFENESKSEDSSIIVVMVRLERFTEIANIVGENGSFQLVQSISSKLREALSEKGFLAYDRLDRYIFIFRSDQQISTQVVNQVIGDLPLNFEIDGYRLHIEYKIGAAAYQEHAYSAEGLLNKAEQALLQTGTHDLDIALYNDELRDKFVRRHFLFGKLQQALTRNELQLYYQAKVDMQTREVVGVEALARWIDSQGHFISPDEFIPVAEKSGLIKPFTEWVVKEAFRQLAEWRKQGIDIKMSINLSIRNIVDPDLIPLLQNMLEEFAVPSGSVVLEITESSFSDSRDQIMETVRVLHSMGFQQSIDDFGTGYSALSYLNDLRVNELKIDQSFVRNLLSDDRSGAIVTSIIQIAHNLGLSVVAEGIENEATADWLAEAGSDIGQGYLFSKPLPNDEFVEFYQSKRE